MNVDLIVSNIGQLVTCASPGGPKRGSAMLDLGLANDAAIAIKDGRFVGIATTGSISEQYKTGNVIDARGGVVVPGFVDPHTHIVFAGDRLNEFELRIGGADYLDILAAGGGIISTVRQTRDADPETLIATANRRLSRMSENGTTTVEIKTGYGLDTATEMKMLRAICELDRVNKLDIVPTFLAAHAIPPEYKEAPNGYVDLICEEMLPKAWEYYELETHFPSKAIPIFADVFCEKNAFDLEQTRRILERAKDLGFKLKAHVDEFTNLGGSRLAIEMGATSIDHLDAISDDEIEVLAASNTIGVITPTVNFNFGSSEFANARKLIDAGCAIALSTDFNPGSAPSPSQPMAMAIACRYQKLLPAEALTAATINAAFALGLGDKTGSVEIGKAADLVIVDSSDYREIPYEFGSSSVSQVLKNGSVIYQRN